MSFARAIVAALLAASLAACSAHKNSSAAGIATGTPAPPVNEATPVSGATAGNGGTMAGIPPGTRRSAAPVPANLDCGSDQPVWVNRRSRVYHEPSDPLYGRTKHGAYMCPAAAVSAGYRKANGSRRRGAAEPNPAST